MSSLETVYSVLVSPLILIDYCLGLVLSTAVLLTLLSCPLYSVFDKLSSAYMAIPVTISATSDWIG